MKKFFMKILDIMMYCLILALMSFPYFEQITHEYLALIMIVLFVIHYILNWKWSSSIFRGRYNRYRKIITMTNLFLFIFMLLTGLSGLMMNRFIKMIPTFGSVSLARKIHMISTSWLFIFISMHIGIHFNQILIILKKIKLNNKKKKMLLCTLSIVLISVGMACFIKNKFINYMFLLDEFAFFDFEKSFVSFIIEYLFISIMFAILIHLLLTAVRKSIQAKKERSYKKIISIFLIIILILTGCKKNDNLENNRYINVKNIDESHILIAYFTWADNNVGEQDNIAENTYDASSSASLVMPGNSAKIANWINEEIGGTLFSIQVENPYPSDYDECLERASEEKANNQRPKLKNHIENIDDYDIVFLGFPNWWYTCPMAIFSFIEEYNMDEKIIIPFVTHGTGGISNTINDLQNSLENNIVLEPIGIERDEIDQSEKDVKEWVQKSINSLKE